MTAADTSPFSGRQIEIRHGLQRAVVVEVGAGLREYDVDGRPVLDGYAIDAMCDGGRGLPLLPWPNRLADGEYTFEGQALRLPVDEVARRNAMHGLTRWLNWNVLEQAPDRVRMGLVVHPRTGYPFTLELSIEYVLAADGLSVTTTARNAGPRALPFGAGQHPYVTVGGALVDSASLHLPAHARLELDASRRLPTGTLLPVDGDDDEFDFRTPRPIGSLVLDDCFTTVDRGADGRARVRLADPGTGRRVELWMDASYRYVQVFTGDTLPAARRRRGLAIEPMTCPPNAFRTGTDVIVLQSGATCSLAWGLTEAAAC
ncbi:MAG TPA: aldose 1-epimerase family protein [Chloroflexota bacterium]|nr:aldose 1-epimerase family protein [Chloroflexota bacterium]